MSDPSSLSAEELAKRVRGGMLSVWQASDLAELERRASERDQAKQHATDMERAAAGMSADLTALGNELTERIEMLEAERDQAVRERDEWKLEAKRKGWPKDAAQDFHRTKADARRLRDALERLERVLASIPAKIDHALYVGTIDQMRADLSYLQGLLSEGLTFARSALVAGGGEAANDPPCPGCGMTAQVEPSRSEPGKFMCHGCARTFSVEAARVSPGEAARCPRCGSTARTPSGQPCPHPFHDGEAPA